MEELRKKYDGLGLNDAQILTAVNANINPKQILQIKEAIKGVSQLLDNAMNLIRNFLSDNKDKLATIEKEYSNRSSRRRGKKSKTIKTWQKNKFYQ